MLMKNITIRLDDDVAQWARVWAARHNTDVSKALGDVLKRMMKENSGYAQAMQQYLSVKPSPLKQSGSYRSRDELHER
jgi:plasmid stability protein